MDAPQPLAVILHWMNTPPLHSADKIVLRPIVPHSKILHIPHGGHNRRQRTALDTGDSVLKLHQNLKQHLQTLRRDSLDFHRRVDAEPLPSIFPPRRSCAARDVSSAVQRRLPAADTKHRINQRIIDGHCTAHVGIQNHAAVQTATKAQRRVIEPMKNEGSLKSRPAHSSP